jgi:hypothetical protein
MANANDAQYEPDRSLNIFSLPSGSLTYSIPYQFGEGIQSLFDFSLSASGTVLGQTLATLNPAPTPIPSTWQVTPTTGGPVIWSETSPDPQEYLNLEGINLSPDGTLIAVSSGPRTATSPVTTTNIFKNGVLATAVNGYAIGWIDNNQLLVNNYAFTSKYGFAYTGASIYSATGTLLSTPTLPELPTIQPIDSNSIYSPAFNTIYSLPSGTALYSSGTLLRGPAAVAGSYVVFASGSRIVIDTH